MFISPAYAQAAGAGGGDAFQAFLPLILIFIVFYFLLIRPQQKKMKQHRETLDGIRRGDKIVTGGGIIGTVTKVDNEAELTVEIAKDVKVKVQRSTVAGVVNRTEPVGGKAAANDGGEKPKGLMASLFGGGQKPAPAAPEADDKKDAKSDAKDASDDADTKDAKSDKKD